MASVGSNEMPLAGKNSHFFEIPLEAELQEEPKRHQARSESPKGGLSFSVALDDDSQANSDLQLAAEALRIKSEKRRSNMAERMKEKEEEKALTMDELEPEQTSDATPTTPSESGTYTLRLDSAEVRERRTVHGLSDTAPSAGDSKEPTHDLGEHPPAADQNSATESTEEYDVPLEVNQRISEWFTRNEAAASRQSEATDTNLEDIRQKAKDRIKERNNPPLTNSKPSKPESKIVLTREERKSKSSTTPAVRSKGSNPQVRLTRAMLLRKNRALGIKTDNSTESEAKSPDEFKKPPEKTAPAGTRKVSARLENLSKPKNRQSSEVARQRSFSHEDAKVYRGRPMANRTEKIYTNRFGFIKTSPRKKVASDSKDSKTGSRSTSLTRGGLPSTNLTTKSRKKTDPLSQSVRSDMPKSRSGGSRNIPVAKRASSLTRSTTVSTIKSKTDRTPRPTKSTSKASLNQSWSANQMISSSSSSRPSRPTTAASQREISHEKSILYSVYILSNNCLQKTFEILNDLGGDSSDFQREYDERTNSSGPEMSPHDVENVLSNLCSLDKCLSKIRSQQKHNSESSNPARDDQSPSSDIHVPSLVLTKDEIVINHEMAGDGVGCRIPLSPHTDSSSARDFSNA
jgi:hypothetical protein